MGDEKGYVADEIEGREKHFYCTAFAKSQNACAFSTRCNDQNDLVSLVITTVTAQ